MKVPMNALPIKLERLQQLLAQTKGAKIITIDVITEPDTYKKDNPYLGSLYKLSKINGIVNWHYANAVNRQREKEGKEKDFVPKPRSWGTRLSGLPFVSHVTKEGRHKLYLEVKVERILETSYLVRLMNGETVPIEKSLIEKYIKPTKSMKEHQDVSKEIICRDYDVANILSITFDGQKYIIEG